MPKRSLRDHVRRRTRASRTRSPEPNPFIMNRKGRRENPLSGREYTRGYSAELPNYLALTIMEQTFIGHRCQTTFVNFIRTMYYIRDSLPKFSILTLAIVYSLTSEKMTFALSKKFKHTFCGYTCSDRTS